MMNTSETLDSQAVRFFVVTRGDYELLLRRRIGEGGGRNRSHVFEG